MQVNFLLSFIKRFLKKIFNNLFKKPIEAIQNYKKKILKVGIWITFTSLITRKFNELFFGQPQKGSIIHRSIEKAYLIGIAITNIGLALFILCEGSILIALFMLMNSIAIFLSVIKI